MQKKAKNTLKLLLTTSIAVFALTLTSTAQTRTNDSAENSPSTAVANQRINKLLDALEQAELLIKAQTDLVAVKDAQIASERQVTASQDLAIKLKDGVIESQKEQYAALAKTRCEKTSFLFGLIVKKSCH